MCLDGALLAALGPAGRARGGLVRFCHGRECSRARFARQRQRERRDDDNVTSSLLASEKFTCLRRFRGK